MSGDGISGENLYLHANLRFDRADRQKRLYFCSFTGFPRQMSGLTTRQLQVNYWAALYNTYLVKET